MDETFRILLIVFLCVFAVILGILQKGIRIFIWERKESDAYSLMDIKKLLRKFGENFMYFSENIPFGRATVFTIQFSKGKEVDFYGFSPLPSKEDMEFKEYGLLLTSDGLIIKNEDENFEEYIPFQGLWNIRKSFDQSKLIFNYADKTKIEVPTNFFFFNVSSDVVKKNLDKLIECGYTRDLHTGEKFDDLDFEELDLFSEEIKNMKEYRAFKDEINFGNKNDSGYETEQIQDNIKTSDYAEDIAFKGTDDKEKSILTSTLTWVTARVPQHLKANQITQMAGRGLHRHGFAAEQANTVMDRSRGNISRVIGGDNIKDGADRLVNFQSVQTKYHSTASRSVSSAFRDGTYRYLNSDGQPMQLEVPRDQHAQAVELMRLRIENGEVPRVTNPRQAEQLVRRGGVTYDEAHLVSQAGNITSLKIDLIDGTIQSTIPGSISFVLTYYQAKRNGYSDEEAVGLALKNGALTMVMSTVIYASSSQITKLSLNMGARYLLGERTFELTMKGIPMLVTTALLITPDSIDFARNRISKEQLKKNIAITSGGVIGGTVGASVGLSLGPVGSFLGGMTGAKLGHTITKFIADKRIEDDSIELFALLKEEFMDIVWIVGLNQDEINEVKDLIFGNPKKLSKLLKDMYQSEDRKQYARNQIIKESIKEVIQKRSILEEDSILEVVDTIDIESLAF